MTKKSLYIVKITFHISYLTYTYQSKMVVSYSTGIEDNAMETRIF